MEAHKKDHFIPTLTDDIILFVCLIIGDVIIFCLPNIIDAAGWLYMIIIVLYLIRVVRNP